jgi:formylglycine-generating enzyme required for sulfatase activity
VYVPAGQFIMGSDDSNYNARPAYPQTITEDFWIDLTETTNAQYAAFIADGGYGKQEYWTAEGWAWLKAENITGPADIDGFTDPDQPRVGVSWYEATAYAKWRGCRLPTEAEWEWAARGPQNFIYPWGNTFIDDVNVVIYRDNSGDKTAKVGAGIREGGKSWVGALDMAGNVWEWTSSLYDQETFPYPYQATDGREDISSIDIRVLRGGAWNYGADSMRALIRSRSLPDSRFESVGFRVVCSAPVN